MTRTTAQRLGDVTLVLIVFAGLTLVARGVAAADLAHGDARVFWSFWRLGADAALLPAFAACCLRGWMDEARDRYARLGAAVVLGCCVIAVVGSLVLGADSGRTSERSARYLDDAATLLLAAGGLTLLAGLGPRRD